MRILAGVFLLMGLGFAYSPITEDLTKWQNDRFAPFRNQTTFKFGASADPHYIVYPPGPGGWRETCQEWAKEKCGFAVICGDIQFGSNPTLDSAVPKYALTSAGDFPYPQYLTPTDPRPVVPSVLCMGNHEVDFTDAKKVWTDLFHPGAVLPTSWGPTPNDDAVYFSFNYGSWHFICLDHWRSAAIPVGTYPGGKLDTTEVEWLIADLHAHQGRPTAIFMHPPINGSTEWQMSTAEKNKLGSLAARFTDVKWIFSGHIHDYSNQTWGAVRYVRTSLFGGAGYVTVTGTTASFYSRIVDGAEGFYCIEELGGYPNYCWHGATRDDATTSAGSLPAAWVAPNKPVPAAPSGLALSTNTDTTITLQWNAAADADYYVIFRDGDSVGVSLFLNFKDYGLAQNTNYTYTVYARNISDKTSASGASGTFSTATTGTEVVAAADRPVIAASPNPFNPIVHITINTPAEAGSGLLAAGRKRPVIHIFNVHGALVRTLRATSSELSTGTTWDASGLPSGVYCVVVSMGDKRATARIFLSK